MKFHNILEDVLSSKIKISLLKIFYRYPEKKFTGRELARLLNASASRVSEMLHLFRKYGIANRMRIGNASEWTLNRENILIKKLGSTLSLDREIYNDLISKISKILSKEKSILKVALFGSVSRGDEDPDSDIDLFILVNDEQNKENVVNLVQHLNTSLAPQYGNIITALIYTKKESELKKKSAIVKQIQKEGKVIIDRASQ